MKNIIQMLGTDRFLRVRIGTGQPSADYAQVDWVLGHFSGSEQVEMAEAFDRAARAAAQLLTDEPERVMSIYNSYQKREEA